jgi:hypothetical protein
LILVHKPSGGQDDHCNVLSAPFHPSDDQYHEQRVSTLKNLRTFSNRVAATDRSDVLLNDLPGGQEGLWEMLVWKALEPLPLGRFASHP